MADKENKSGGDHALYMGTGLFLAYMILVKFDIWLNQSRSHQFVFAAIAAIAGCAVMYWALKKREKVFGKRKKELAATAKAPNAVFCGTADDGKPIYIKPSQRSMHTQVVGTTNAGKTESVILPWAIQDMAQGRGLILIDGKSDRSLLEKLKSYAAKSGRENDFQLFSLASISESLQFNPLIGGTTEEVAERVFNSFEFDNPHYRSVQYEVFAQFLRIFQELGIIPTFLRLHQAITQPAKLHTLMRDKKNSPLKQWLKNFSEISAKDRVESTSGLTAAISHFAFGNTSDLFNTENPTINLEKALAENKIVYFQLPVLLTPFLGKAAGKMILQCLQAAVANRHRGADRNHAFFGVFLDDFTEYLYPGFVSVLNKSRSANVGVVFAHQALGDLKTLGDPIANSILTNSNLKIFMRGNEPESAEYFSKVIGTSKTVKYTEQTKKSLWSRESTGDASAREVDEFIIHPNTFKNELGVGEAVMVIPHEGGSKTVTLKFSKYDDLPPTNTKANAKIIAEGLPEKLPEQETKEAA